MFAAEPGVFAESGTLETFAAEPGFLNTTVAFVHSSTPEIAVLSWLIDLDKALIKKLEPGALDYIVDYIVEFLTP